MKKIIFSMLLLAGMMSCRFAFAGGIEVNPRLHQALQKEFSNAKYVHWESIGTGIYKASFYSNEQRLFAFFDKEGTLVATARYIPTTNLPFLVSRRLASGYAGYEIKSVMEYAKGGQTNYLITMENAKTRLSLIAQSNGNIQRFKKEKIKFQNTL